MPEAVAAAIQTVKQPLGINVGQPRHGLARGAPQRPAPSWPCPMRMQVCVRAAGQHKDPHLRVNEDPTQPPT